MPHLIRHALVDHHLSAARHRDASPQAFRHALEQLATLVAVEATRDLPTTEHRVPTPLATTEGRQLTDRLGLVPILRAGIAMVAPLLKLLPEAEVWHLGLYRDESTAEPVHYYSKLPAARPVGVALVLDPMLATGGSATAACQRLVDWGVQRVKMLSIIAAPEGIARLESECPAVEIFACAVDTCLNEEKFIVPGLGDAGDRLFNTIPHGSG